MYSEVSLHLYPGTPSKETFFVAQMVKNQLAMQGTWV